MIKKIESHEIGEEMYDQLLYESLYAKEVGTSQMMKNNEFDIILNTCKKRQEFKKTVEMIMKSQILEQSNEDQSVDMDKFQALEEQMTFSKMQSKKSKGLDASEADGSVSLKNGLIEKSVSFKIGRPPNNTYVSGDGKLN